MIKNKYDSQQFWKQASIAYKPYIPSPQEEQDYYDRQEELERLMDEQNPRQWSDKWFGRGPTGIMPYDRSKRRRPWDELPGGTPNWEELPSIWGRRRPRLYPYYGTGLWPDSDWFGYRRPDNRGVIQKIKDWWSGNDSRYDDKVNELLKQQKAYERKTRFDPLMM